ncbi:MAG: hypothetical protein AAF741_09225 [Bacteroidota bacterium]
MNNWYVPITLLPSVGFFIVATTSVSNALSAEIARLIELARERDRPIIERKMKQMRIVNNALVLLYAGASMLALTGLIAGLEFNLMLHLEKYVAILICVAIGIVIIALGLLMIYAWRAVRIKEEQFRGR